MAEDTGFDPSLKKKKKKTKKIVDLDASEEPVETAKSEETSLNEITNKENETVLPVQESQEKEDVGKFTIIRNLQYYEFFLDINCEALIKYKVVNCPSPRITQ